MSIWKQKIDKLQTIGDVPEENDRGSKFVNSGISVWFLNDVPLSFKDQLCSIKIKTILQTLYESDNIEFLSTKPVIKTGVIKFSSPWHQDYKYWGGSPKISAWIAMT
eukprot:UN02525